MSQKTLPTDQKNLRNNWKNNAKTKGLLLSANLNKGQRTLIEYT